MFGFNLLRYWKRMNNLWGKGNKQTCMSVPLRPTTLLPPGNWLGVWELTVICLLRLVVLRGLAFSEMANNYIT